MSEKLLNPIEVDMVIISWAKNPNLLQESLTCIKTLTESEDSTKIKFNIVMVESDKDTSYDDIDCLGHSIKTVYSDKQFGYHTYLNVGLEHCSAEWSCLCNNDLVFKPNWASEILGLINAQRQHNPEQWEYVSASPCNPREKWHQRKLNHIEVGYAVRQHIAGWCLFQSRNIFDKIGPLEERVRFWFCDNWYSVALQHKKIPHIFVGNSIVEHHNGTEGTTTKEAGMSKEEHHKVTYGAGDEFREIVREMVGDKNWGRPSEEIKKKLKAEGRSWY
jgi:GT2 family glycosyltransferase